MKDVHIGIIGLGFMGTTHYGIYRDHPSAQVVAIADQDPAKRAGDIRGIAGNLGDGSGHCLDLSGIRVFTDGLELIQDPDVRVVDICSPLPTHKDLVLAALAAGKTVFCEKPLARTAGEAAEIVDLARQYPGKLMVGMCIRFWPEYRHAATRIRSGAAGGVLAASFKRVSPSIDGNGWQNWFMTDKFSGGALLDLHLHDVDFVRELLGMPVAVSAFGARGIRSDRGVDHVFARFDYGDGSLVTLEGGWSPAKGTAFEMSFQLVCEHQTLRLGAEGYSIIHESGEVEHPQPARDGLPTGWHEEIDHLLSYVREGRELDMDLPGIVDSIRLVEFEAESIQTNLPIQTT